MKVGEIACGRAGDKGPVVDFTIVARDAAAYEVLASELDEATVAHVLEVDAVERYEVPGLHALKFVSREANRGGAFASLRAGVHSQKAWVYVLLDHELS